MKEYLRAHFHSLASLAIRALSVLAGFLITFFLGHEMGPLANGQYALIAQTAMFLSIVAVGGMDLAVVRHFSATVAHQIPLSRRSLGCVLAYSMGAGLLIVAILAVGGSPLLSFLFGKDLPRNALLILCVLLLARTCTRLMGAVLRSQDSHIRGQSVEVLIIPGVVSLMLVFGLARTLHDVLWATAALGVFAAGYGIFSSLKFTSSAPDALDVPLRPMFQTSLPLWATAISLNIADWYSLATAATRLSVYDAGLFRVAFQIGGALTFVAMGMYNVFTARISAALATGDIARVARLSRSATRLSAVCIGPVVVVLLLFAEPLLGLISPEFERAAPLLRIIVVGQALNVLTGPAGLVLAMTGHERINFAVSAAVTGALLIVLPVAAHFHGLFGIAAIVAFVPVVGNLANLFFVWKLEHINVVTGRFSGPEGYRNAE